MIIMLKVNKPRTLSITQNQNLVYLCIALTNIPTGELKTILHNNTDVIKFIYMIAFGKMVDLNGRDS